MLQTAHFGRTVKFNAHTLNFDLYRWSPFKWLPPAHYFRLPHL